MPEEKRPIFCPHCGTRNKHDAYMCDRCGERVYRPCADQPPPLGLAACGKCSAANEAHAFYCVDCGGSMASAVRMSPEKATATDQVVESSRAAESVRKPDRQRTAPEGPDLRGADVGRQTVSEVANNSGMPEAELPESLRGFNWGAFLVPVIWSAFNRVWIGMLTWVGVLALLIDFPERLEWLRMLLLLVSFGLTVYLGFKGNELAWRSKRWRSAEHFTRVQRNWLWASLIVTIALFVYFYLTGQQGSSAS